MRSFSVLLLTLLISGTSQAKYQAHEWGTFTSVVDSEGKTQNGMYHEDEALPDFVHGFGELRREPTPPRPRPRPPCNNKICFDPNELQANIITQKMETPVIYFYADEAQTVNVNVRFPEGVITETYPGPVATFPTMSDPHVIGNGNSTFELNILTTKTGTVPFVSADNIYGHARAVNSNIVTSGAETEKFLFYRGLGRFQPKISITSKDGNLALSGLALARPQAAFLIHVDESGDGQLLIVDTVNNKNQVVIPAGQIAQLKDHSNPYNPLIISGQQARGKMIDELVLSGLFKDEAVSMINTWENGYLKVPGLRLLYLLPRREVDEILPLTMTPEPEQLVRTFVARMEVLLDTEEQAILARIITEQDRFKVQSLGRFAEPVLHRIRALAVKTQSENSALLNLIDGFIKEAAVGFTASTSAK